MKKRITILMTTLLLTISVLSGCGAESTTTEPTETATATTTEESTTEQAEEATATSEETAEPTPEVKEEPSEETTVETEPETEPTETVAPEPTEEPAPEPEPQATYTYTDMSAIMYAQQTVNVRDLPDTHGNKIGSLSTNDEIKISGKCNETGWYMFEYNGSVAFVSNKYVSENKVEVQQAPADNGSEQSQAPNTPASNSGDWKTLYSAGTWYDMGEFVFIIEYGNDWTMQHNWSDWEGKYPYVDFSAQAKTDDARIFFAYSNPDSKTLSNFLKQYTH